MKILSRIFILTCIVVAIAPMMWHAMSSLKNPAELTIIPPTLVPHAFTLYNYQELFARRPFLRYCLNSLTIAGMASLLSVTCASLAAYRLARSRGRWRSTVRLSLLALAFFPPIVFIFPLYEWVQAAGLINHPWGLILPNAALNLPFAIWLLTGSFEQIPFELEEAAAVDGLSRLQTFRTVILPLSVPALVTTGILAFIATWNEFMFALTFMNIESQKTVTLGIATLSGAFADEIPYGLIAAGVVASSIPLIILVVIFQRRIISGLTAGAVK